MLVAVLLAIVVQVLSVLGLWSAAAAVLEDPFSLGTTLLGGLSYLPVMWIMVGLAACLIAFAPKRTSLIWLYLGYTFFVIYFGGLLQVPEWIVKLTPFGFVPDVPLETMSLPLTSSLLVVAIGLALLGLKGYQKRDIQG
jgi:ABC-2 type transport system permease protein